MSLYYYVNLKEHDIWIECKEHPISIEEGSNITRYRTPTNVVDVWENHNGANAEVLENPGDIDVSINYDINLITKKEFLQVFDLANKLTEAKINLTNLVLKLTKE